jgi:hypothetical protein
MNWLYLERIVRVNNGAMNGVCPLLCALVSIAGTSSCSGSLYKTAEVTPGEQDYPVASKEPADIVEVRMQTAKDLVAHLAVDYRVSASSGGTMASGTSCQREIGLAVTAPFMLAVPIGLSGAGAEKVGHFTIDKFEPGRCDWQFGEVMYQLDGTSIEPQAIATFTNSDQSNDSNEVDIWCTRRNSFEGQHVFCATLGLIQADSRCQIPESFLKAETLAGETKEYPVKLSFHSSQLIVRIHDVDATVASQVPLRSGP